MELVAPYIKEYKNFFLEKKGALLPLIFWIKASLALILTCFVAFEFETPEAAWAVICAAILAHPDAGAVFSKSIARIIGTIVGAFLACLLFYNFPQAPWIFLIFLSLWVGLCAYTSSFTRDFQVYAISLSGFMPAIIFMTAIEQNTIDEVVRIASIRAITICIGIICVALVFGLTHIRKGYKGFLNDLSTTRVLIYQLLNTDNELDEKKYLHKTTSFIQNLKTQLNYSAAEDPEVKERAHASRALINDIFSSCVDLKNYLNFCKKNNTLSQDDEKYLENFIETFKIKDLTILKSLIALTRINKNIEYGLNLRVRTLAKYVYLLNKEFTPKPIKIPKRPIGLFVDLKLTARMALAGVLVVLSSSLIWILTEWNQGPLFITFATSSFLLQANKDNYSRESTYFFLGCLISIIPAFIAQQLFMPMTYGFIWFSFWLSLAILPACLLKASKKYSTIGVGCFLFTSILIFPNNTMNYDFQFFLNTYFALVCACGLSVIAIVLTMPFKPITRINRTIRTGLTTLKELPLFNWKFKYYKQVLDAQQERYELLVRFYNQKIIKVDLELDNKLLCLLSVIKTLKLNLKRLDYAIGNNQEIFDKIVLYWKKIDKLTKEESIELINLIDSIKTEENYLKELTFFKENCNKIFEVK